MVEQLRAIYDSGWYSVDLAQFYKINDYSHLVMTQTGKCFVWHRYELLGISYLIQVKTGPHSFFNALGIPQPMPYRSILKNHVGEVPIFNLF